MSDNRTTPVVKESLTTTIGNPADQYTVFRSVSCEGERCSMCGAPADMKIGEEIMSDDPNKNRHNATAYVCRAHGRWILFGEHPSQEDLYRSEQPVQKTGESIQVANSFDLSRLSVVLANRDEAVRLAKRVEELIRRLAAIQQYAQFLRDIADRTASHTL